MCPMAHVRKHVDGCFGSWVLLAMGVFCLLRVTHVRTHALSDHVEVDVDCRPSGRYSCGCGVQLYRDMERRSQRPKNVCKFVIATKE